MSTETIEIETSSDAYQSWNGSHNADNLISNGSVLDQTDEDFMSQIVKEYTNKVPVQDDLKDLHVVALPEVKALPLPFFSPLFYPFWILLSSFFLLFLSFNLVQNLASTLQGDVGSVSIAILYIFYIIGNILAPATLIILFKNDPTVSMFFGSLTYTVLIAANIVGTYWAMVPAAILTGLGGGPLWVGNGVFVTSYCQYIGEKLVEGLPPPSQTELDPESGHEDAVRRSQTNSATLEATASKALGIVMSVSWANMNLNSCVGGFLAYAVLSGGEEDGSSDVDASSGRLLFFLFTVVSLIANGLYGLLYRNRPPIVYLQEEGNSEDVSKPIPTPISIVQASLSKLWVLAQSRLFAYSMLQFIAAGMTLSYYMSAFNANAVKETLGAANVAIALIIVSASDIVGALCTSNMLKTRWHARIVTLVGSVIQLLVMILIVSFPHENWSPGERETGYQWFVIVSLSVLTGLGDGVMSSGLNTGMGLTVSHPLLRSSGFGILSAYKGFGSFLSFLFAAVVSYGVQTYIMLAFMITSVLCQLVIYQNNMDIDQNAMLGIEPVTEDTL